MRVVGTAGHVDHGKSTLVTALTGINPDRLKEEKSRQMTIELGFAWLTLPDGEETGIVDVPGHRDFIENMLAGVGGIDAVLFVVAADEGVMPQTREHLAILDILQIKGGIIVLTKVDLVDDPAWLDLVEDDVRQAVAGTVLENAPVVRVSARNGIGIIELKQALVECLGQRPPRPDMKRPRLPIDRVFSISGFGTIVTGTLSDGILRTGDEVEILPGPYRGRIRGLQGHKRKEDAAYPGSRTAANISGVDVDQVNRGEVLVKPGTYIPTQRLDVHFRSIQDASGSLRHNTEVKFFLGAAEVVGRIRLLDKEEILPGQEGWLQIELKQPVVAVRGDRYILRRPSPGETLGGGVVVDALPIRRHKRFSSQTLSSLEALRQGTPAEVLFQASLIAGVLEVRDLVNRARITNEQAQSALDELLANEQIVLLEPGANPSFADKLIISQPLLTSITQKAQKEVDQFHRSNPLRQGMPREELKSRLKMSPRQFTAFLRAWLAGKLLKEEGVLLSLTDFKVQFNTRQQAQVNLLLEQFRLNPYNTPSVKACILEVGEEVYTALIDSKQLIQVSSEVVYTQQDYEALLENVQAHFKIESTLTAQFRDRFKTSRKYALAFLEFLDANGITIREGDNRRLK
jgi:selenocysteine-specific elongation factor